MHQDNISEPHLGGGDSEGGVGQLLILRLLPGQTSSIFHLPELVGKLKKKKKGAFGGVDIIISSYHLVHFECFDPFFLTNLVQLLLSSKPEAVHSVGPAVGPLAKLLRCPGEAHAGHHRAVDDCLYGATEPISVYLFSARVALLSQSINQSIYIK